MFLSSKLCDSCKSATATLFCRADSAFLCVSCDGKIHAANKLASRHGRKIHDGKILCVTCDRDIHSANPLSRRHERVPVTPFFDPVNNSVNSACEGGDSAPSAAAVNFLDDRYFSDDVDGDKCTEVVSREEAEAASWLLPNPKAMDLNSGRYVYPGMDPFLDLDYGSKRC